MGADTRCEKIDFIYLDDTYLFSANIVRQQQR